jgi:hypothetical protein
MESMRVREESVLPPVVPPPLPSKNEIEHFELEGGFNPENPEALRSVSNGERVAHLISYLPGHFNRRIEVMRTSSVAILKNNIIQCKIKVSITSINTSTNY